MTAHVYVPLEVLTAENINASLAGKADLDPVTGKVLASELPDLAGIAASAATAAVAPVAAQAAAAGTAAASAQATANAAIPASQEGQPNGIATLGADGILTPAQRPPAPAGAAGPAYTPPHAADFPVFLNQGTSTATDTNIGLLVQPELIGASAGNILKGLFKPLPTGDFDIEIVTEKFGVNYPFVAVGVSLMESSSGRYHSLHHGAVYFSDPWNNSSNDAGGISQLFWTNANTISDGIGLPLPVIKLHQRITRVGNALTRFYRTGADAPWVPLWGQSIPSPYVPDRIGISWLASANGYYTSFPSQVFTVRHFGAVL